MVDVLDPRTPITWDRAATEVVQCRRHLAVSRQSLELALAILGRLNGRAGAAPTRLQQVLRRLEETEEELRSAVLERTDELQRIGAGERVNPH
jgi:hypothetical protein